MRTDNPSFVPVYFSTLTDRIATYVFDTIYQNTVSVPILVTVSFLMSAPGNNSLVADIGSANPPTFTVGRFEHDGTVSDIYSTFSFVVPPSYYYRVAIGAGTPSLYAWVECS